MAPTAGLSPTRCAREGGVAVGGATRQPPTHRATSSPAPPAYTTPACRQTRPARQSTTSTFTTIQVRKFSGSFLSSSLFVIFRNWYSQLLDVCNDHDSLHLYCVCWCQHLHFVVSASTVFTGPASQSLSS